MHTNKFSVESPYQHSSETSRDLQFKEDSLSQLKQILRQRSYPGYPDFSDRLVLSPTELSTKTVVLPDGPWETTDFQTPSVFEYIALHARDGGARFDTRYRPLHPWFNDMVSDESLGVVTGKGALWRWGPNHTADTIVIRHDLGAPHVLLITRSDTGSLALPGGFIDAGESSFQAALREVKEETGLELPTPLPMQEIYHGPVADVRMTANAWIETTAYRLDIPTHTDPDILQSIQGQDDAVQADWFALDQLDTQLFGSHFLLIERACRQ